MMEAAQVGHVNDLSVQRLLEAAKVGSTDELYAIVRRKPYVLEQIDKVPFTNTPLHIAATAGHTHFATEVMNLQPSFTSKLNPDGLSPMHLALQNGHIKIVNRFSETNPELVRVKGRYGLTPLHCAVQLEELSVMGKFLSACPDSINDRTTAGETALHIAAKNNKEKALRFLMEWLKLINREDILSWEDEEGTTLLHLATPAHQFQTFQGQTVDYLYEVIPQDPRVQLMQASQVGNVNDFYATFRQNPSVLEQIDQESFVDTPLHIAAAAGHACFCMEMMNLKPSFAKKLNRDGFSPIHLALQNNHHRLVHRLIDINPNLVRVKGKDSLTPLHYAVEMEKIDILIEFFTFCPESIKDRTSRQETALHMAVKNKKKIEVFKVLMDWINHIDEKRILSWRDEERNTVLHLATATGQPQVVKLLLERGVSFWADINATNIINQTALDIFEIQLQQPNSEIGNMLRNARALRASRIPFVISNRLPRFVKILRSDVGNAILVVAVLIATATYQTGLSPPGGVWQDDYNPSNVGNTSAQSEGSQIQHSAGKAIMGSSFFLVIMSCNSLVFFTSIGVLALYVPYGPSFVLLYGPLVFLSLTYMFSLLVTSPSLICIISFSVLCFICVAVITVLTAMQLKNKSKLLLRS